MHRSLFILISLILTFSVAYSQEEPQNLSLQEKLSPIVYFGMGGALSTSGGDFKDTYNRFIHPTDEYFEDTPLVKAGFKFYYDENFRIGLGGMYFFSKFTDPYTEIFEAGAVSITRNIRQDIEVRSFPILADFEYIPYRGQFKSYFGMSLGISLNTIRWKEDLSSTSNTDSRVGGEHFSESKVTPAINFKTGVELGFDSKSENYVLNSLILEFSYLHIFRREKIFESIGKQYLVNVPEFNKTYSILPGFFVITASISLNFYHDKLK